MFECAREAEGLEIPRARSRLFAHSARWGIMKTGRNAPCPCGSGKKYKHCHLGIAAHHTNQSVKPIPSTDINSGESPINEEGFLSEHLEPYRQRIRAKHQPHYALVFEINKVCQSVKFQMHVHSRDGQEVLGAALFIKLLADVQAAVLLLERGLPSQARSLLRVAIEALILLGKLSKSYEFVEALIRLGEQQRLRLVRAIQRNPSPDLDSIRSEISEDIIRDIEQIVGDISNESLEQWARELGLLQFYDVGYRLFSNDVHSKPRALEHYLEVSGDGEYAVINWGPQLSNDLEGEFLEAARILTVALSFVNAVFTLNIETRITEFTNRILALNASDDNTDRGR